MIEVMAGSDSGTDHTGSSYARFFGLGFTFIAILAVLAVTGLFVDRWLGTLPLFLLVGVAVGFAVGLYYVYRALQTLGGG